MKIFGFGLLGFFLALLTLTLFAPTVLNTVLLIFGTVFYYVFFDRHERGTPLLVGFTLGLELLGNHHFGIITLCSLIWYGLFLVFAEQLRFTSPYARFIVALALGLVVTTALLYPPASYLSQLFSLGAVLVLVGVGGALLQRASEPSAYELL